MTLVEDQQRVFSARIALGVGLSLALPMLLPLLPSGRHADAAMDRTRREERALHAVVESWRANHGACPSFERLRREGELSQSSEIVDRWNTPYVIVCADETTVIFSAGPDGRLGDADDVRFGGATEEELHRVRSKSPFVIFDHTVI